MKVPIKTIHIFFISNLLDSTKIHIIKHDDDIKRSLDNETAAGFIFASSINLTTSKEAPYCLMKSIFAKVGNIAPAKENKR